MLSKVKTTLVRPKRPEAMGAVMNKAIDYLCLLAFLLPVTAGGVLTSLDIFPGLEFWAHKLIGISCALALAYPAWVCIQKFKPRPRTS